MIGADMSQDETMLGKGVLSRRDCVKLMGGFAIAMGTGSLLAGCSSGTSDSGEGASQSDETPKTLRVAMMGSSTDTLDPATFSTLLPLAIALNVYDSLILLRNGVVENSLAESIEPNEDASAWTVTLKDGVKYLAASHLLGRGRFRRHLRVPGGQRRRRFLWRHRQRALQARFLLSRHWSRA